TMHWIRQAVPKVRDYLVLTLLRATPSENPDVAPVDAAPRRAEEMPFVSVVLPTHNRSAMLRDSLAGLARQTYPARRFEVIVVNDGSVDETEDVVQQLVPTLPFPVRYVKTAGVGAIAARNLGMREA